MTYKTNQKLAIDFLKAVKVNTPTEPLWAYKDDATQDLYVSDLDDLIEFGQMLRDETSDAYSLWCGQTAHTVASELQRLQYTGDEVMEKILWSDVDIWNISTNELVTDLELKQTLMIEYFNTNGIAGYWLADPADYPDTSEGMAALAQDGPEPDEINWGDLPL